MAFSLTKWYLDVVTTDGRVAIAYWADVRWGHLHQNLSGLLLHDSDARQAPWAFSGRAVAPPASTATGLRWSADVLDLSLEYSGGEPGFQHRIVDGPDGAIDWHCVLPRAGVRCQAKALVLEGTGYVERVEMTMLPWRIPADEIRWGRCHTDASSIVWIDWRGPAPRRLVFSDGRLVASEVVSDDRIRFPEGTELVLGDSQVISADVLGGLLEPLKALQPLIAPIAGAQQVRWRSRATLHAAGQVSDLGWALHERVSRR